MRKLAAMMALIALLSVALSATATYAAGGQIQLTAQGGSGEDGTATLNDLGGGKTQIVIEVKNGTADPQPAYIQKGTCSSLDPAPAYLLTAVSSGKSDSTLDVSLDDLQKQDYAINIHKSAVDIGTYVSCGNIKDLVASGSTSGGTSGTTSSGGTSTSGTSGTTTSGTGNTTSGTTTSGSTSSGNTTSSTSSGTGANIPTTGVGDDPLPLVLLLLGIGLVALLLGRKFARREPEIL